MTISATPVFKPKRLRTCPMCAHPIRFDCVRLYGAAFRSDKPYVMYICYDCARRAIVVDPKLRSAVERLERGH